VAVIDSDGMACYKPIQGYRKIGGGLTFKRHESSMGEHMSVPCGNCIGCRAQRSKEWAIRCMHESSLHDHNCFITLTYNEDNLPMYGTLVKSHFQKFMKRLRKQFPNKKIRYYMCGEYGDDNGQLGRPHFHAILFGFDFPNKTLWEVKDGKSYYRSQVLEKLWPFGYSNITDVNFKTAAYVARYVMKKINGEQAENHYLKCDKYTGELHPVLPEYNAMSLKPGIAHDWYTQFKNDVFPHDFVVCNGQKQRTPRYYINQLKKEDEQTHEKIKKKRKQFALKNKENNTPERLQVRQTLAEINSYRTKRLLT
jgi:hypothetical protein